MSEEHPSYEHYIITASQEVPLWVRLRDILLTVALWLVYLYFIRESWPFVVDLARWIGNGFDDYTQYSELAIIPTIQAYGQVAGVMTVIYLGWALYNMLRFRGRGRRKPRAIVAPEDLASMYGFSPETVVEWQDAPSMIMHHDEHGHLTDVKVGK
jgi:poly-beta-1,6-N-acetyl-D-glucosamine biosynthesis protein PgaD